MGTHIAWILEHRCRGRDEKLASLLESVKEQVKAELTIMGKDDFLDLVDECMDVDEVYAIQELAYARA